VGVCLDPRKGLSGSCIQTRRLQQCVDTETDPRVDPEACRQLGVRSIVVLPLIDGDELFGIVEVLSSRPNAFAPRDLDTLQALTVRIVESRRQNREAPATVPRTESGSLPIKVDQVIPQDKSSSLQLDSRMPQRERTSRRRGVRTPILGALVIAAAVLLGALLGWRLGWERATLGFRASSARLRAEGAPKSIRTDRTPFPGKESPPTSAGTDECGPSAAAGFSTQPPSGGLTVCQEGRVIFRLVPPAPSPMGTLQTSQRSPGLKADPVRQ
jgi:hypothetical protein